MQLTCLDGLVGVSHKCSPDTPTSSLFIDEHDGISIELSDAAIDSETQSGIELLETKLKLAQNDLANDVRQWLLPRVQANSTLEQGRIGVIDNNRQLMTVSGKNGIKIDGNVSGYTALHIHTITLWIDAAEAVTVFLYDRNTGETLDTYSITTVANEPTSLAVNETYYTNKNRLEVALVAETTGSPYRMSVYQDGVRNGCRGCRGQRYYSNRYISAYGTTIGSGDTPIDPNYSGLSHTGGLAVDYAFECSMDKYICNMRNLLATSLWYKAGEYTVRAYKNSTRLNAFMRLYNDDHEDLISYFRNQYQSSLQNMLDTMRLPDDICFSCNQRVYTKTNIP